MGEPDRWRYLKGLMSRGSFTQRGRKIRRQLADDKVTLRYLEAGVEIINRAFTTPGTVARLFDWLTLNDVQKEANTMTLNALRHRWREKGDLFPDVLAHSLSPEKWEAYFRATDEGRAALFESEDFPAAVHDIAYNDLVAGITSNATRVGFIAAALADSEPQLKESLVEMYRLMTELWCKFYTDVLTAKELHFREGMDVHDFAFMLSAISEGLQLRLFAGDDPKIIDHERHRSLLGTAALLLFASCIDHKGDGMSLEDFVRSMIERD